MTWQRGERTGAMPLIFCHGHVCSSGAALPEVWRQHCVVGGGDKDNNKKVDVGDGGNGDGSAAAA